MDKKRAQEIASSPVMANVAFNGTPVYIENVNENRGTANIHSLDNPRDKREVSVKKLEER